MKPIGLLALGSLLAFWATPSFAQYKHHDWSTALGDDKRSVYASNVNSDGSVLMETCSTNTKSCTWLLGGNTKCDKGMTAPALVNADNYAGTINLKCEGEVAKDLYSYSFSDWKTLESLIKDSKSVGIAVAIGNTQFKVYRFSLFGMTEAQKDAEQVFEIMLDNEASTPKSGNSIL